MKKVLKNAGMALALLLLVMQAVAQVPAGKKVAVLPLHFIGSASEEMRYRLQDITYDYLRGHASGVQLQDPVVTNAMLGKKLIEISDLRKYTPAELAAILEVDYVVTGRVSQEAAGGLSNRISTGDRYERRNNNTQTRSTDLYHTYIELDIYESDGDNIYSKSRKSILYDVDAYKGGLHYLLKRSPLVSK